MDNAVYAKFIEAKNTGNISLMKHLYKKNKNDVIIKFEYGKMLARNKQLREARKIFKEILSFDKNIYSLLELGRVEFKLGNIEEARRIFLSLIGTKNQYHALFELGRIEANLGNLDGAAAYYKRIIDDKADLYAMLELGRIEVSRGNFLSARKLFDDILKTRRDVYAIFEIAKLEMRLGNLKEAKKMLESILDSSNRNNALLELAKTEFMLGNVDASKVYLNTLLNTPNRNAATIELGRIEYMQGNIEKSIALFKSLIGTCSENYALPLLININIKLGRYEDAFDYMMYSKRKNYYCDPKAELIIMKELNVTFDKEYNKPMTYSCNQILDYDPYSALEHIIARHKYDFSSDIDIPMLFDSIGSSLSMSNFTGKFVLNDVYDVPFENVGSGSNILRVITLPGTKQILSMYPLFDMDYIDGGGISLHRKK